MCPYCPCLSVVCGRLSLNRERSHHPSTSLSDDRQNMTPRIITNTTHHPMKSRELRDPLRKTLWSRSFDGFVANVVIGKVVVSELPHAFSKPAHSRRACKMRTLLFVRAGTKGLALIRGMRIVSFQWIRCPRPSIMEIKVSKENR